MPLPPNAGMMPWDVVGQKLGQFGNWAGDVLLGEKQKAVAPSYQVDYGQMDEDRARQAALYAQLQQMAAGNGPSLAQGQLQQATDQNIRQAMALGQAQQGQGMGYASALRGIADQSAQARQQAAAQSAMIRNAEQMQAMQGMGALGGQMFGQDLARQQLGAGTAMGYDQMNINAGKRQGGILPGILQAAGGIGGMMFGGPAGAAAGSTIGAGVGGGLSGGGAPNTWDPNMTPGLAHGGRVPGYAQGGAMDSKRNDTVPAMLSPGEIVLPRSITMAPDAEERAKLFVAAVLARRKQGTGQEEHPAVRQAMRKKAA